MARPLKRTVDYFPHMVNIGKTLLILQNEFGNDGYAFWFKLLTLLCKTDGQVYDYNNPASWRLLLAETSVSEDTANKVLQLLADIEAIDPELYLAKIIWVQHLVDNLSDVYTRRRNGSVPSRPVIDNINPINASRKPQTRQDQTKQNQTIPDSFDTKQGNDLTPKEATTKERKHLTKDTIQKKEYGEFTNVLLTDRDYQLLVERFTEPIAKEWIETLSSGMAANPKKYKYDDHRAAILQWERRDRKESQQKSNKKPSGSVGDDKWAKGLS